jgi:cell fate regulator YaaT (PSP1 superfamily)
MIRSDMTEATSPPGKEPSMFDLPEWVGASEGEDEKLTESQQRLVGVRFQPVGKVYHYKANGFDDLKVGDWVIVDTARGKHMGQIATFKPPKDPQGAYKRIERRATGRDMAMRHYYEGKELEAMIACRAESAAFKLPIKIVRAEYSFDGQTLTFLFSSDQEDRVEVGALREVMSRLYRARIEMRQISPREVAKILGGMGACGIEERCCSRFLTEFSPVSIKHAKEQNLSLNPHDITGMCGRLRCCLVYEYEQYVEARRHLPKLKSVIGTPLGPGKVVEILHLRDAVRVKIGDGSEAREVEFHREQIVPLEEMQRLQEKAMSGTCDRHESGQCDCGKGRAEVITTGGKPVQAALPPAARAYVEANEAHQEAARSHPDDGMKNRLNRRRRQRGDRRPTDVGRQQPRPSDEGQASNPQQKRRPLLKRRPDQTSE